MPPKCSVWNQMFVFILTPNLNLHSGSGSKIWLNQTSNKMLGSCSNIVRNVQNWTAASLLVEHIKKSIKKNTPKAQTMPVASSGPAASTSGPYVVVVVVTCSGERTMSPHGSLLLLCLEVEGRGAGTDE